jgi:hypothetical protein
VCLSRRLGAGVGVTAAPSLSKTRSIPCELSFHVCSTPFSSFPFLLLVPAFPPTYVLPRSHVAAAARIHSRTETRSRRTRDLSVLGVFAPPPPLSPHLDSKSATRPTQVQDTGTGTYPDFPHRHRHKHKHRHRYTSGLCPALRLPSDGTTGLLSTSPCHWPHCATAVPAPSSVVLMSMI